MPLGQLPYWTYGLGDGKCRDCGGVDICQNYLIVDNIIVKGQLPYWTYGLGDGKYRDCGGVDISQFFLVFFTNCYIYLLCYGVS